MSADWPLWEVFVRARRGISHVHAGSVHAPDAEIALQNARDLFTRRSEGVSLWVVRSSDITASSGASESDGPAAARPASSASARSWSGHADAAAASATTNFACRMRARARYVSWATPIHESFEKQ